MDLLNEVKRTSQVVFLTRIRRKINAIIFYAVYVRIRKSNRVRREAANVLDGE